MNYYISPKLKFSGALIIKITLIISVFFLCAGCTNKRVDAANIADALKDKLSHNLEGTYAKLFSGTQSWSDGDDENETPEIGIEVETEFDPGWCCLPQNPCMLDYNGICECPDSLWDVYDCVVPAKFASFPFGATPKSEIPLCPSDIAGCRSLIPFPDPNSSLLGQLKLGWFPGEPLPESGGQATQLCSSSPAELKDKLQNSIFFAFDQSWLETGALLITLSGTDGYGLLPIDQCGLVTLPGSKAICGDATGGSFIIAAQAALVTYSLQVGPYVSFDLKIVCSE